MLGMNIGSQDELDALQSLTQAGCSSSPKLLAWKHEAQQEDGWVPGGFQDYILMEKVPGEMPPPHWNRHVPEEERAHLCAAFKEAFESVYDRFHLLISLTVTLVIACMWSDACRLRNPEFDLGPADRG